MLQPQGQLSNATEYNNLVIATRNGSPVYLRDVATAIDSIQDERIAMHFWVDLLVGLCQVAVLHEAEGIQFLNFSTRF